MKTTNWLTLGCLCMGSIVIITACSTHTIKDAASAAPSNSMSAPITVPTDRNQDVNTSATSRPIATSTPKPAKPAEHAIIAGDAVQQTPLPHHSGSELPAYNNKQPKIMGLAIQETKDQVIAKYGLPKDTFVMDDPKEPITVFEYDGFNVGFSADKHIQFVDVDSASINPGLNGLRLGQTADDAIHALGKPDSNSLYVLSYRTKQEVLKLDVDPKTQIIQSIKLFGAN